MRARSEILTPRARWLLPVFLVVLVTLSVRSLWCAAPERVVLSGEAMGTTWAITLNAPGLDRGERARLRRAVEAELDAVDDAMSTWDPDSELSRFNAHASEAPFRLSPPTLEVLAMAREVSEQSEGAFDVTARPLVAAWGFGAGARAPGDLPDEAEIAALRRRVGFERLELDPEAGTARKRVPDLEIDLSAIAKGFAVDRVARALEARGLVHYLVEVGGEVRARGERPGASAAGWRVAIEEPDPEGRSVHAVVVLRDRALATSGDYRAFYEAGGRRLTHIVDPRTGRPIEHGLASVSVVHERAALADAWATALTVLGPEAGFARAESFGLAAYFVARGEDGSMRTRATPAFPPLERSAAAREDGPGAGP